MPTCELVTIGSELLSGSTLNTNAQFLARCLAKIDMELIRQVSVRDVECEIIDSIRSAFERADLILISGGLGPTPDDITREAVAKFFGCDLKFNQAQYRHIRRYFNKLGRTPPIMTRKEAFFPAVAKPLLNRFGIALGFYVEKQGHLLVALPGVPRELEGMYDAKVETLILDKFKNRLKQYRLEAHLIGLSEVQVMKRLRKSFFRGRSFDFGIYPAIGEVVIRVKMRDRNLLKKLEREIKDRLGPYVFSFGTESVVQIIGTCLRKKNQTLAVAESCTGGWLAKKITDEAGASDYFLGGTIPYLNQMKTEFLNVSHPTLRKFGAVSPQTAKAMAEGVLARFNSTYGIAITGIAGPGGRTKQKPVGLVYISIARQKRGVRAFRFRFGGLRDHVRLKAVWKALELLWLDLKQG